MKSILKPVHDIERLKNQVPQHMIVLEGYSVRSRDAELPAHEMQAVRQPSGSFAEMVQNSHLSSLECHNSTILSVGRHLAGAQWVEALQLFHDMQAHHRLVPNVITYNAAISDCGKGSHWDHALQLFHEVQATHLLKPNVITYSVDSVATPPYHAQTVCYLASHEASSIGLREMCMFAHRHCAALRLLHLFADSCNPDLFQELNLGGIESCRKRYDAFIGQCILKLSDDALKQELAEQRTERAQLLRAREDVV